MRTATDRREALKELLMAARECTRCAELAAANFPASEITGVVIHSSPGFVADHLSAMGTGPTARKQYWARADTFIDKSLPK